MTVLWFARRTRSTAVAVALGAALLLLAMRVLPAPAQLTGVCDVALVYGAAIAVAAWLHERQQLRTFHADVAAFLQAQA